MQLASILAAAAFVTVAASTSPPPLSQIDLSGLPLSPSAPSSLSGKKKSVSYTSPSSSIKQRKLAQRKLAVASASSAASVDVDYDADYDASALLSFQFPLTRFLEAHSPSSTSPSLPPPPASSADLADLAAACRTRLAALSKAASEGNAELALRVAFLLTAADRETLSAAGCELESVYDGLVDLAFMVSMNTDMTSSSRQTVVTGEGESYTLNTYGARSWERSNTGVPMHGFTVGETFVATDSALRCFSVREKASRGFDSRGTFCHNGWAVEEYASPEEASAAALAEFLDASMSVPPSAPLSPLARSLLDPVPVSSSGSPTSYATGSKRMAVAAVCYEGLDCSSHDSAFDESDHWIANGGFLGHLEAVMGQVNDFYGEQSRGQLEIEYVISEKVSPDVSSFAASFLPLFHSSTIFLLSWGVIDCPSSLCLFTTPTNKLAQILCSRFFPFLFCFPLRFSLLPPLFSPSPSSSPSPLLSQLQLYVIPTEFGITSENCMAATWDYGALHAALAPLIIADNADISDFEHHADQFVGIIFPNCMEGSSGSWAGQAWVGMEGWWVRWGGDYWWNDDGNIVAHEIGHNVSLC